MQPVIRTAASDERRHYDWVDMTLQSLGVTDDSALGVVSRGVEAVHARTHDGAEAVETQGTRGFEAARRAVARTGLTCQIEARPFAAALALMGVGVLLGSVRRSR